MSQKLDFFRLPRRAAGFALLCGLPVFAQGGKEFLQWLKEYSPTGYFIINDFETRGNEPGSHKRWIEGATAPVPGTAVHETCHMRDGLNGQGKTESFYVGNFKDCKITPNFTPFNSKEMMPDIPASLENFQTDVYISGKAGTNAYSMSGGLVGILGEFNAYVVEMKASVEMAPCFKANFNTAKNWQDLTNDENTAVWSNSEFRYFVLRYILWAQKKYPDIYAKIMASMEIRECYTQLVNFAEQNLKEYTAVLIDKNLDTKTGNGFDWYWKFWNELQKAEYKDLEKLLFTTPVAIMPNIQGGRSVSPAYGREVTAGVFDVRGRMIYSGRLVAGDAQAYRGLRNDLDRKFAQGSHVFRIGDGKAASSIGLRGLKP